METRLHKIQSFHPRGRADVRPMYDHLQNQPDPVIMLEHMQSSTLHARFGELYTAPRLWMKRRPDVENGGSVYRVPYEVNDPRTSLQTAHIASNDLGECMLNVGNIR